MIDLAHVIGSVGGVLALLMIGMWIKKGEVAGRRPLSWLLPLAMAGLALILTVAATGLFGANFGRDHNAVLVVVIVLAAMCGAYVGVLLSKDYYSKPRR